MSIGAAFYPQDGRDAEQLLAVADRRMLPTKSSCRSRAVPRMFPETEEVGLVAVEQAGWNMRALIKTLALESARWALPCWPADFLPPSLVVAISPGFDVDERELDPRLNQASRVAIQRERAANQNILDFYVHRLDDRVARRPRQIPIPQPPHRATASRAPAGDRRNHGHRRGGGWALAFALALPAVLCRVARVSGASPGRSQQILMCLPAAALASVVFDVGGPVRVLVALVVFPRVFRLLPQSAEEAYAQPHILTARAKGLGGGDHLGAARVALRRSAISGVGRRQRQHGLRRGDSRGGAVRSARHRTIGLEGGHRAGSAAAGGHHSW